MKSIYRNRLVMIAPLATIAAINLKIGTDIDSKGGDETLGKGEGLRILASGPATNDWFSTVFSNDEISLWQDLVTAFPTSQVWVWNLDGDNSLLISSFNKFVNVTIGEKTPDQILTQAGLQRLGKVI